MSQRLRQTQRPVGFGGSDIGVAYRSSRAAHKITQLLGDSLRYDFSAYEKSADFVLVDAGHEYVERIRRHDHRTPPGPAPQVEFVLLARL